MGKAVVEVLCLGGERFSCNSNLAQYRTTCSGLRLELTAATLDLFGHEQGKEGIKRYKGKESSA